ncbi:hypothetical protein [Salinimicrobium oceani]|uniref:TonB-dependent receptor n=1 Tax=Salinimicrobium oceani TaxID=2722702 RepID=A0ABX1CXU5_9FLAO|nr:hypothetical protein [Salinimicrobium oceani]NJW53067.1 hypothetical protein [Salinimicrobium oceani]
MKFQYVFLMIFCMWQGNIFGQESSVNRPIEIKTPAETKSLWQTIYFAEDEFQLNLVSWNHNIFDVKLKLRMEDELSSEENYRILSQVSFFDLEWNYRIGPVSISWSVENLLNMNSPEFAIEGNLERDLWTGDRVIFEHASDFRVNTAISYSF